MYQVTPDWIRVLTASEFEEEIGAFKFNGPGLYLRKDFKFNGPGLYLRENTTLLVIPFCTQTAKGVWDQKWPCETKFTFYMYYQSFEKLIFSVIATVPTRQDDRE